MPMVDTDIATNRSWPSAFARALLGGCFVVASLSATAASVVRPHVTVALQSGKGLVVTAEWPAACAAAPRPLHDNPFTGDAHARHESFKAPEGASGMRYEVPLSTDAGHSHFARAHPEGSGVYSYLDDYLLDESCGPVDYTLDAPGVMLSAGLQPGPLAASRAELDGKSALLVPERPTEGRHSDIYVDPALDARTRLALENALERGRAFYATALPHASYPPTGVVMGVIRDDTGVSGYGGEATNIIRLNYYNLPLPIDDATRVQLQLVMLHEVAHRFHPEGIAESPLYPLPPEGAADFLRWLAATRLGIVDARASSALLDDAFSSCSDHTGAAPWQALSPAQRRANHVPYDCGVVAYALGLALRQGPGTALDRVDRFFAVEANRPDYDLAAALECGPTPGCTPKWLPRLFGARESFAQVLDDVQARVGLVSRLPDAAPDAKGHAAARWHVDAEALLARFDIAASQSR